MLRGVISIDDSDHDCFESYLKLKDFHEVCEKVLEENLKKFHDKLEKEYEHDRDDDKKCVFNWYRENQIEKLFLRSLAKNEIEKNESMRLSFDDLVLPSIRWLREISDFMCNLEMIFDNVVIYE